MTRPPTRDWRNQAYGRRYRKVRAMLLAGSPPCHWCGAPATTADHEPPLELVGRPHFQLVPACAKCNFGRGNDVGRFAKRQVGPSRDW